MVESLSYILWPCGVNAFLAACETWAALMKQGTVTPSPRFAVWAEMAMGGFDPESGAAVGGFDSERTNP